MTVDIVSLLSDNLDIWTTAVERKSGAGRGGGKRISLYGVGRLRALIFDLAMHGKLVPQEATDEPASELLLRVTLEGAKSAALSKGRTRKRFEGSDSIPIFEDLPSGWVLVRLAEIAHIVRGVTYGKPDVSDYLEEGKMRLLRGHNIQSTINFDDLVFVSHSKVSDDQILRKGDIVIAMSSGSPDLVGKGAKFTSDEIATFGAFCGVVRPFSEVIWAFLALFCKTPMYRMQTQRGGRGIGIQNLSKGDLEQLQCPLPPLAEQQRIVAKVDELMALCDALESESAAAMAAHQTLVEALLATLTASTETADLAVNWTRLETYFDTLFTTEASVDALKQTILELAVSGRLVANAASVKQGTLGDVGDWVGGNGFPKQYQGNSTGEVPFLKVSDMNLPGNEREITVANNWVSPETLKSMKARAHPAGTIIFPKIGGAIATNKRRILSVSSAIDNNCAGQIPAKGINVDWLFMVLSSIDMAQYQAGTSVPALNMKKLAKHSISIPDEDAQKAIVARVYDLLSLCDLLAARVAASVEMQRYLADTIVELAVA